MGKLSGKVALITGGTSGMGKATAGLFAREGATVLIVGRDKSKGEAAAKELNCQGNPVVYFFPCDLSVYEDIQRLAYDVQSRFDHLDILFNNAGIFCTNLLQDISPAEFDRVFKTNVASAIFVTKFFIDMLIKSQGVIINTASIGGLQSHIAGRKTYLYAASKAAVIEFSQLCALNYADRIRVNCLCPGPTDTPLFTNRDFSRFDGTIPLGRMGHAMDVAQAALFLASEDAAYITGAILTVDGGASLV